jgi:hypothetical protein
MQIVLNKVLTGTVQQMSDVILIHYLKIHLFTEKAMKEWFFGRLYIIYTVIFELTLVAHVTHLHIHSRMPSVHDAQTNVTLHTKIQCALSFVPHCTHMTTLPSF